MGEDGTAARARALMLAGELEAAAALLRPRIDPYGGMGFHCVEGYRLEKLARDAAASGDVAAAREHLLEAAEQFLIYSLIPARGDAPDVGLGFAADALAEWRRLGEDETTG